MANSTVINEDVVAKVVQIEKRGKEGSYKELAVKVNGKDHVISKNDKSKVKVGQEYHFKLTKSEYNDKLYYWANLIDNNEDSGSGSSGEGDDFKKQVFSWLNKLSTEEKKKTISYLLERL